MGCQIHRISYGNGYLLSSSGGTPYPTRIMGYNPKDYTHISCKKYTQYNTVIFSSYYTEKDEDISLCYTMVWHIMVLYVDMAHQMHKKHVYVDSIDAVSKTSTFAPKARTLNKKVTLFLLSVKCQLVDFFCSFLYLLGITGK